MSRYLASLCSLLLWSAGAIAQSTSGWQTVTTDGTGDLYTNGTSLTDELEIIKPAYACYSFVASPLITADTVDVIDGTIESGTVTNTRVADGSYLIVGESGRFDVRFAHTNFAGFPAKIDFTGYYDGNPAHEIDLYLWDWTDSTWDLVQADAIPDTSGADVNYEYAVPSPQTNYVSGGVATSRWYHSESVIASHDFAIDYTAVIDAQVSFPTANAFVVVSPLSVCDETKRVDTNTMNFTNQLAGVYEMFIGGSGTGTTNTTFTGAIFTNDVQTSIFFKRTIGDASTAIQESGNASDCAQIRIPAQTTISFRLAADRAGAWASFFNFHGSINRIDD